MLIFIKIIWAAWQVLKFLIIEKFVKSNGCVGRKKLMTIVSKLTGEKSKEIILNAQFMKKDEWLRQMVQKY